METSEITLGELLKRKREGLELNYRDAATASGVNLNTYWRAEQGRSVSRKTRQQLANWLDLSATAIDKGAGTVWLDLNDIAALDNAVELIETTRDRFGTSNALPLHPTSSTLVKIRQRWDALD
jgi:transcriptional regulator with XRE-family HTH domain